jgi:cleavage and polyadenylation specificity factor subunit 1
VDYGASGKLALTHYFTDLAGTVCYLESLHVQEEGYPDSFLIGFAGHPRLAVVTVATPSTLTSQPTMLEATSLIDLTQALMDQSLGSVTPLEQDLMATLEQKSSNVATLSVILGGGVAVAAITLRFVRGRNDAPSGWSASEPYLLPLATLKRSLQTESVEEGAPSLTGLAQSISHGFGDIISACFLSGYLEPTLVLLHSNREHGRTWSGRLGRPNGEGGTHYGLVATAVSLTVAHRRSAVLWSVEVPADALSLHAVGEVGCLVMSVNSLAQITNSGHMGSILAVNGWTQSTCPSGLLDRLQPNPWPLPKLAIQLDGAKISFVSEQVAIVSLRQGQLYLLQHLSGTWSLMALGRTLGVIGQISDLLTLPLADVPKAMLQKLTVDSEKKQSLEMLSMGLLFAGSRLGDSSLLGYTLEGNVTIMDTVKQEVGTGKKQKVEDGLNLPPMKEEKKVVSHSIDEYEMILQREEDALYAPADGENTGLEEALSSSPDVIPPSSDEETDELVSLVVKERGRSKLVTLTLLRSLNPLDTITSLGPLGPGCEGPLSKPSTAGNDSVPKSPQAATSAPLGATVRIFPCGYGSSGGLALLTLPGRDDRSILAEADCLNAQCIFSLPLRGLVLLGMGGSGVSVLRVQHSNTSGTTSDVGVELSEVDLEDWCLEGNDGKDNFLSNSLSIFRDMTLLSAADIDTDSFVCLVMGKGRSGGNEPFYGVVTLAERDGKLRTIKSHPLVSGDLDSIRSVTPMVSHELAGERFVTFGCTWSSGKATITTVGPSGTFETQCISSVDINDTTETEHETEEERFYRSDQIHAMDIFLAPEDTLTCNVSTVSSAPSSFTQECEPEGLVSSTGLEFDDEDAELYRDAQKSILTSQDISTRPQRPTGNKNAAMEPALGSKKGDKLHVAVCRQSGMLELYVLSNDNNPTLSTSPIWESPGCGQGASILAGSHSSFRHPRMHTVHTSELRFFFTGPTPQASSGVSAEHFRTFNLVVQTSNGDVYCYEKNLIASTFSRVPLHDVARQSKEESRHRAKLRRKGILGSTDADQSNVDYNSFRFNRLHPFTGISGQDGLFAAIARPVWFASERGSLAVLSHRCRHVAPAGGRPLPVAGFCVGLLVST